MKDYKIQFEVDGKAISLAEIEEMEMSRYHHVFKIFVEKGIAIKLDGVEKTQDELLSLSREDAKRALAQTREEIGKEKTLELFSDEIKSSDQMWKEINETADFSQPYQQAIVDVKTENISLPQFMMFNQLLAKKNDLYMPSTIHPEHYFFDANNKGEQRIIETFGMYKDPSYLDLKPAGSKDYPIKPDDDTDIVMMGKTYLADSGLDTTILGMHQLKDRGNGMEVKLGVFLPESAPKEIIDGHKWHLMVEFKNGLEIAAKKKPNFLQKMLFKIVLKKLKSNKN
ncbi:uncharacterized protein RZ76_08620 [Apilactobacillus kunkeei]|uniref:hypothetical protein n=1 Tax=Apilactobacillus kunkeei TaxID=148814 RepID=UPI0006CE7D3A|nr:hypothetical protein [Apilactobacillus kunkeei]KPN82426.1 uncharacterized protein RZ76_08620 [Apilactobacillus kunkeei]